MECPYVSLRVDLSVNKFNREQFLCRRKNKQAICKRGVKQCLFSYASLTVDSHSSCSANPFKIGVPVSARAKRTRSAVAIIATSSGKIAFHITLPLTITHYM